MSQNKRKPAKKTSKQPRNIKEPILEGLDNFIIRTRRQSEQEKLQAKTSNMAEVTQACASLNTMPTIKETSFCVQQSTTALNMDSLSKDNAVLLKLPGVNAHLASTSQNNSSTPMEPMELDQHENENALTTSSVKGKVAEMVDKINSTPTSSPVSSPRSLGTQGNMNTNQHVEVSVEQSTVTSCCDQHGQLMQIIRDLSDTTKSLNETVCGLQQEVTALRAQKTSQDNQVSEIVSVQKLERERLDKALETLKEYDQRFSTMVGIMSKQNEEISGLKRSLNNSAAKSMKNNLVITGLDEDKNENATWAVLEFFKSKLKIQENILIHKAFRIGAGVDRPMIVELTHTADKAKIFQQVGALRGLKNGKKKPYFVSDQLPEDYAEKRRQESYIKAQNNKLPTAQQMNMSFKKGELFVDNNKFTPPVKPPTIKQQVLPSPQEQQSTQQVQIFEGNTRDRNSSTFIGYAARVKKMDQVEGAYRKVRLEHPDATHVMCAFRFPGNDPTKSYGMADDGENGAARRLLGALGKEGIYNMAVFVVRYYGGTNIGPDRFQIIESVAKSAVEEVLDSERPLSTPWNNQADDSHSNASWGDVDSSDSQPFLSHLPLPNDGRASLLKPDYLTNPTTSGIVAVSSS